MLRGGERERENGRKFSEQTFARAAPTFRINPTFNFHHVFRAPTSLSAFKCTAIGPVWLFMKLQKRFPPGWLESWNVKFYCPIWQHLEFSGMDHLRDVSAVDTWVKSANKTGFLTHSSKILREDDPFKWEIGQVGVYFRNSNCLYVKLSNWLWIFFIQLYSPLHKLIFFNNKCFKSILSPLHANLIINAKFTISLLWHISNPS